MILSACFWILQYLQFLDQNATQLTRLLSDGLDSKFCWKQTLPLNQVIPEYTVLPGPRLLTSSRMMITSRIQTHDTYGKAFKHLFTGNKQKDASPTSMDASHSNKPNSFFACLKQHGNTNKMPKYSQYASNQCSNRHCFSTSPTFGVALVVQKTVQHMTLG